MFFCLYGDAANSRQKVRLGTHCCEEQNVGMLHWAQGHFVWEAHEVINIWACFIESLVINIWAPNDGRAQEKGYQSTPNMDMMHWKLDRRKIEFQQTMQQITECFFFTGLACVLQNVFSHASALGLARVSKCYMLCD